MSETACTYRTATKMRIPRSVQVPWVLVPFLHTTFPVGCRLCVTLVLRSRRIRPPWQKLCIPSPGNSPHGQSLLAKIDEKESIEFLDVPTGEILIERVKALKSTLGSHQQDAACLKPACDQDMKQKQDENMWINIFSLSPIS